MPLNPAVFGLARFGNSRFGYIPAAAAAIRRTRVAILINGLDARTRVRYGSLTIHDALNDAPNTAQLTVEGTEPLVGQSLRVTVGYPPTLLFNGTLQTVDRTYDGLPGQRCYPCSAIDDLARLNRRLPFGTWTNVSATTIAQSLITTFAPGFTSTHVQAGLPLVSVNFDGTEGFSGCLQQLAKLIGGYFYVEDLDLHLFQTEASDAPDDLDSTPGRFLDEPHITASVDVSQVRTRVYGKGYGSAAVGAVPAGATVIPIANANLFAAGGGQVISETQIVAYTGVALGTATTTSVGDLTPVGVSSSPVPNAASTTGAIAPGTYQYSVAVQTATGVGRAELFSPTGTIATLGDTMDVGISVSADPRATGRVIYRSKVNGTGGSLRYELATIDNVVTTFSDGQNDTALGALRPLTSTVAIPPGTTTLVVLSTTGFPAAGWITVGGQVLAYTSLGSTTFSGIPASGPGAILVAIPAGSVVTAVPMLTGVTGLTTALLDGAPVHVWVQRDDVAAQTAMAALAGGDGIYEHLISDERRGPASLMTLCDADLAAFKAPIVTVTYASRDLKTKSGKPIVVDLPSPAINETLTIQDVTIDQIDIAPGTAPRFSVTASGVRFSVEDLLRRLAATLEN